MIFYALKTAIITVAICSTSFAQHEPGSVRFNISEIQTKHPSHGTRKWLATHESKGLIAKFEISLELGSVNTNDIFSFAKGSFHKVPGSTPTAFLHALKVALEAKNSPKVVKSVSNLPFTCAVIGMNQSQGKLGGFSSNPPGDWIVTKVFLLDGEAEVFLNLNPKQGVAEFSIKDEEYGNMVLKCLASVM